MPVISSKALDPVFTSSQANPVGTPLIGYGGAPGTQRPPTGGPATLAPSASAQTGAGSLGNPALYGGIGGGVGSGIGGIAVLLGAGGEGGDEFRRDALQAFQSLQIPDFDFTSLTPPQLRLVALMSPETYEAQVPGEVKLIMDSPEARAQMQESIAGLGTIAREGLPEADRLAAEEAANQVRGAMQSSEEAFITNLRRRGRLGAGAETQARAVAGRGAAELGSRLGRGLQAEALNRRMQALRDYGSAAGAMRAQDVGVQQSQADAMNRFQEIAAMQRQQAAQYGAGARERTQAYNVGTRQDLATGQAMADYQTQRENLERQNQLRQAQFAAEADKASGLAAGYGGLAQSADAEKAARERNLQTLGGGLGQGIGGLIGLGGF